MDDIYELIGKSISKEITQEEKQTLELWINKSDENRSLYESLQKCEDYTSLYNDINKIDIPKAKIITWFKIQQLNKLKEKSEIQIREEVKKYYLKKALQYAAVFLLLIGSGSAFFFLKPKSDDIQFTQITAPKGARTNLKLADGTSVWLNAGSVLKYDNSFNKKDRVVYLDGEAFFDVSKNKEKPFYVKTSDLSMRVVGTSFNVKSYSEEGTIQTTLVTGSIVIEKNNEEGKATKTIVLKPNQRVTFIKKHDQISIGNLKSNMVDSNMADTSSLIGKNDKLEMLDSKNEVFVTEIDVEKDISWKDGYLVVSHEPLEDLAVKLARRYDVRFTFMNEEIKKYKFTGKIYNLTLDQVLNAIKLSSAIEYKIDKKNVIIRKK